MRFLLAGAALFALHRAASPGAEERRIRIGRQETEALVRQYQASRGAPPDAADRARLVARRARDEALFQEALGMGLHLNDVVVRRRLVQTMELLAQGTSPIAEPTDEELGRHLEAHRADYLLPERSSLTQVFVDRERHGRDALEVAGALLARLRGGADPRTLGEPFARGQRFSKRTEAELAAIFGPKFAQALGALPEGSWAGPVASSYGWHLVRVDERVARRMPQVAEVREALRAELVAERRAAGAEEAIARIVAGYAVDVE